MIVDFMCQSTRDKASTVIESITGSLILTVFYNRAKVHGFWLVKERYSNLALEFNQAQILASYPDFFPAVLVCSEIKLCSDDHYSLILEFLSPIHGWFIHSLTLESVSIELAPTPTSTP